MGSAQRRELRQDAGDVEKMIELIEQTHLAQGKDRFEFLPGVHRLGDRPVVASRRLPAETLNENLPHFLAALSSLRHTRFLVHRSGMFYDTHPLSAIAGLISKLQ